MLKSFYLCVTTMAMGFELIAVLNSTLCSMLGPGLALRGPDGSMHRAVDGLMLEWAARPPTPPPPPALRTLSHAPRPAPPRPAPPGPAPPNVAPCVRRYRLTFVFFTMGLVAFHISALLFAWLEFSGAAGRTRRPPPGLPRLPPSAPASRGCFTGLVAALRTRAEPLRRPGPRGRLRCGREARAYPAPPTHTQPSGYSQARRAGRGYAYCGYSYRGYPYRGHTYRGHAYCGHACYGAVSRRLARRAGDDARAHHVHLGHVQVRHAHLPTLRAHGRRLHHGQVRDRRRRHGAPPLHAVWLALWLHLLPRVDPRGAYPHHAESRPSRAYPSHSRTPQADAANYAPVPSQREGINELLSGTGIADGPNPSAPAPRKRTQEVETKPNSNPHPSSNGITTRARARARARALSLPRPGREDHRAG